MVTVIIGSKGSVAGQISPLRNPAAQLLGFQEILSGSRPGEVRGTSGVGVKSCILEGPPVAKASHQNGPDGKGRKLGARTGLDTRVVLAVNDTR